MALTLDDMTLLARALVDADHSVEQAELALKTAKERSRVLHEETVPSAMQELGVEELKLATGEKLTLKQEVYASIPAPRKAEAFAWLTDNGFGGLIKLDVEVAFGKGELDAATELYTELVQQGLSASIEQGVHPQTLKAFLREQLAQGVNLPLELFGARPVWTAKLVH